MVKKKVVAVAAAALLAVPVIAMPASAKDGDVVQIGGLNVKMVADFESCQDKLLCGMNGDKLFVTSDQTAKKLNFQVLKGVGVDKSMGVALGVQPDFTDADALQDGIQYNIELGDDPTGVNFVGMTDYIVHVDFSNAEVDDPAINLNFTEWDYDTNGQPRMEEDTVNGGMKNATTTFNIADDVQNTYYYMADGDSDWTEATNTVSWVAKLPKHFVGYVRIPVAALDVASGWGKDENEQMDLLHVTRVGAYFGFYGRDAKYDYVLVVDNFGFAGDFSSTTDSTPNGDQTGTSANGSNTGSTTKNSSNSGSNSGNNSNGSATTSNPSTGEAPITAAVAVAAVFAGVLVISRKKARK